MKNLIRKKLFSSSKLLRAKILKNSSYIPSNNILNKYDSNIKFSLKKRREAMKEKVPMVITPFFKLKIFTENFNRVDSLLKLSLKK